MSLEILYPDKSTRLLSETAILGAGEWAREMGINYHTLVCNAADAGYKALWVPGEKRKLEYPTSFFPDLIRSMGEKTRRTPYGTEPFYYHLWAMGVNVCADFEVRTPSGNTFRYRHESLRQGV